MATAEGTFDIDRFDTQEAYDNRDGVTLARAHITKTFRGDLAGNSETDIITVPPSTPLRTWASSGSTGRSTAARAASCCSKTRAARTASRG